MVRQCTALAINHQSQTDALGCMKDAGLLLYKLLMEPGASSGKDDEVAARIQLGYVKRHFMAAIGQP